MKEQIINELKNYNIHLNNKGVDAIMFQVELAYGKQATEEQIKDIVHENSIEFFDENKEMI